MARRPAHRLALADLREPMPSRAELDAAHEAVHAAPREACPRCAAIDQLTLF